MAWNILQQLISPDGPNWLLRILAAIAIVIVGFIVGSLVAKLVRRVLEELEMNRVLSEYLHLHLRLEQWVGVVLKYIIYVIAVLWALSQLGITSILLQLGIVILIVVVSVIILLQFKNFLPNLIAGIMIQRRRLIIVGEKISVGAVEGRVRAIGILETKMETKDGDIAFIPNTLIIKEEHLRDDSK